MIKSFDNFINEANFSKVEDIPVVKATQLAELLKDLKNGDIVYIRGPWSVIDFVVPYLCEKLYPNLVHIKAKEITEDEAIKLKRNVSNKCVLMTDVHRAAEPVLPELMDILLDNDGDCIAIATTIIDDEYEDEFINEWIDPNLDEIYFSWYVKD